MDHARYLELLQAEAERLLTSAREAGLDAPVPTCPGWSVRDLVDHVSLVYRHEVECVRRQEDPEPWPPERDLRDSFAELEDALAALLAELGAHHPDEPAFTWHEPEQTVGFWARRTAHETTVHRVDAELAAGDEVSALDEELATDGIDEVLRVFVEGDWPDVPLPGPDADRLVLRVPGRAWTVVDAPERLDVHDGEPTPGEQAPDEPASDVHPPDDTSSSRGDATDRPECHATVEATAADLLLWAWGRVGTAALTVTGDPAALVRLQQRLAVVTG